MCQPFPFNPSLLISLFNFWEPNVCLPRRHLHQQATHTKLYDTLMRTSDMNQVKRGKCVLAMSRHSSSYTRNDCSLNPRDPSASFYGCNFQRDYFPFAKKKKNEIVFMHTGIGMPFQRRELASWRREPGMWACGGLLGRACVHACVRGGDTWFSDTTIWAASASRPSWFSQGQVSLKVAFKVFIVCCVRSNFFDHIWQNSVKKKILMADVDLKWH